MENSFAKAFGFDLGFKPEAKPEIKEEIKEEVKGVKEKEIELLPADDLVDEIKEQTKEEVKEVKKEVIQESLESPTLFEGLFQELVNKEVVEFDEEKEYEPTEEGLKALIEETVVKRSQKELETFKESLGEDGKSLLSFLEKGLTVEDFLASKEEVDYSKVALVNRKGEDLEQNQVNIIIDYLKLVEEYSDEEIEEEMEALDPDLLRKKAEKAQEKLVKWKEKKDSLLIREKEIALEQERERQALEAEKFETKVKSTTNINGFNLSKEEASQLYDYITKADKSGKTQFQKEDTEENRLLYAYFSMKKFNKEAITKEVRTQQSIKLKKQLDSESIKGISQTKKINTGNSIKDIKWLI